MLKVSKQAIVVACAVAATAIGAGCGGSSSSAASGAATSSTGMSGMSMGGTSTAGKSGAVTSPAADLQVTLDELLGEHALLAVSATQKGYDGSADFAAVAKQLDANSVALSKAIASIYGAKAGDQFLNGKNMWRAHIKDFVAYTVALKKHDKAGEKKAVTALGAYVNEFGAFLAKATGLPASAVQTDLAAHVGQLKAQIDAYASGNYAQAAADASAAYQHMFMTGQILATGIVTQNPSKFMH